MSVAAHVDVAIAAIDEQVQHAKRVRAITKAATKMLTAHDESIVLSPGALIDRAKSYISQRCKNLVSGSNFNDRTTQTALDPLAGSRFVPGKVLGYGGTPCTGPRPADRSEFRFRACSGHVNA